MAYTHFTQRSYAKDKAQPFQQRQVMCRIDKNWHKQKR